MREVLFRVLRDTGSSMSRDIVCLRKMYDDDFLVLELWESLIGTVVRIFDHRSRCPGLNSRVGQNTRVFSSKNS